MLPFGYRLSTALFFSFDLIGKFSFDLIGKSLIFNGQMHIFYLVHLIDHTCVHSFILIDNATGRTELPREGASICR